MKWFKKTCKHSVCKECGVHFEPVTGYEAKWGDLCSTHRKPAMERDEKKGRVVAWASKNWERLTEQMEKETAEEMAAFAAATQNRLGFSAAAEGYRGQSMGVIQDGGFGNVFGLGGRP